MLDSDLKNTLARVDSHQHFWRRDRGDYDWLTADLAPIYHDFLPKDLRPKLAAANIAKTILVQAAPTEQETNFLLMLADETDYVAGVVGWIDMMNEAPIERLRSLARHSKFKGIRPMIQDIADTNWILNPKFSPIFETMIELDTSFDALVKPHHLGALLELLLRHPNLKVVIDHGAKPEIAKGHFQEWAKSISLIASDTQAYCKLSGLVTEAGENSDFNVLKPYMGHLLDCFGAERLMWGSDWPILNLTTSYRDWHKSCESYLSQLTAEEQNCIWSKTATDFYRL